MEGYEFAGVPARTREQRIVPKDREANEQARLRDRIGQYYRFEVNNQAHMPEPTSSHFIHETERFNKDFAS